MLHLLQTIRRRNGGPVSRGTEKLVRGLSVMKSPLNGFGCFATVRFPKTSPIAEYSGERITHREAMLRMRGSDGKHISELDADCYIDGSVEGNDTQYINHSCEPNADAFNIDGFMIVFALREIVPGEEITVDYLNSFEEDRSVCQCRTASCRQRTNQKAA
ncbi:MAG TPA: SET domain-containing protein-lysine N-methyltransferase [Pyrinomonadaceae bacterium]|nr:SET domain-containing protein-lysine N-methyltransferase [Pyrinomonadaceae bacterium]